MWVSGEQEKNGAKTKQKNNNSLEPSVNVVSQGAAKMRLDVPEQHAACILQELRGGVWVSVRTRRPYSPLGSHIRTPDVTRPRSAGTRLCGATGRGCPGCVTLRQACDLPPLQLHPDVVLPSSPQQEHAGGRSWTRRVGMVVGCRPAVQSWYTAASMLRGSTGTGASACSCVWQRRAMRLSRL